MKRIVLILIICSVFACNKSEKSTSNQEPITIHIEKDKPTEYTSLEQKLLKQKFVDIASIDSSLVVDLGYAKDSNFTGKVLYDNLQHAFLHPVAAEKLTKALQILQAEHPAYTFSIFDALRPRSVQQEMWEVVSGTQKQRYVANPSAGSIHNYGLAVDLSIFDMETNQQIDMGSAIDHLGRESEYRYNQQLVNEGLISMQAKKNRQLLRTVMMEAGFRPINTEWWHFNALSKKETRASFQIVE